MLWRDAEIYGDVGSNLIVVCVACVCVCVAVSQALKENSYPFLALIVLRDNRMTVVSRIEGPIGQRSLLTYIMLAVV